MTTDVNQCPEFTISNKFKFQIQFVMFLRGHPGTPIDPAPVLLSGKHCSTSHSWNKKIDKKFWCRVVFRPGSRFQTDRSW